MALKEVKVTGRFYRINAGVVGLTKEQAKKRAYGLEEVKGKKGVYNVVKTVEFKRGEVIRIEEKDIEKASRAMLEPIDGENGGEGKTGGRKTGPVKDEPDIADPTADGRLSGK